MGVKTKHNARSQRDGFFPQPLFYKATKKEPLNKSSFFQTERLAAN